MSCKNILNTRNTIVFNTVSKLSDLQVLGVLVDVESFFGTVLCYYKSNKRVAKCFYISRSVYNSDGVVIGKIISYFPSKRLKLVFFGKASCPIGSVLYILPYFSTFFQKSV